jgi:hypothetical protein
VPAGRDLSLRSEQGSRESPRGSLIRAQVLLIGLGLAFALELLVGIFILLREGIR